VAEIEQLSRKLHGSIPGADEYTFRSLAEHVQEVRELLEAGDGHWKAETLDIIIHALVLLKRHGVKEEEINGLFTRRTGRFREKITDALKQQGRT
jgi:phosphoribosyl-ATP pyrophosphohydrolase